MPGVGALGGGRLVGNAPGFSDRSGHGRIESINIAEQHMLVQVDQSLHERTVKAVEALANAIRPEPSPDWRHSRARRWPFVRRSVPCGNRRIGASSPLLS